MLGLNGADAANLAGGEVFLHALDRGGSRGFPNLVSIHGVTSVALSFRLPTLSALPALVLSGLPHSFRLDLKESKRIIASAPITRQFAA